MPAKLTCIIVDDEPPALALLASYVRRLPDLELTGSYENAIEALQALRTSKPDLVFLDIHMPEFSGLELIRSLQGARPQIVLTTAYPDYAAESYTMEVTDYLVKPFPFERFVTAVNKVKRPPANSFLPENDFLMFKIDKKLIRLNLNEVLEVTSTGDYVQIGSQSRSPMIHCTLQEMEKRLGPKGYARISRSTLIRLDAIASLEGNSLMLTDGRDHKIGPVYREKLLSLLNSRIV